MCCFTSFITAQKFALPESKDFEKIKFRLINNVIVIPMEVNGSKLSFIIDSGVTNPILFNLSDQDSIQINSVSEVTIKGLGDGEPIKALRSLNNSFKMGKIKNPNQKLYVVLDKELNPSTSLGIPIHGIIGYDLFKNFIVDINYRTKNIKFYKPDIYSYKENKKSETLPLLVINKKAYVDAKVISENKKDIPLKLLVDTGSSDAIWLFENENLAIPDKNYDDFLGRGLGGDVYGKRAMMNTIQIGSFLINEAKTAFPEMDSFVGITDLGNRNGSVGGEVLKRFNIVFDYPNRKVTLQKNKNFNTPFQYNMSGIDLQHNGVRYIAERIANVNGLVKENEKSFGDVQILFENETRLSLVPEIIVSGIRADSPADAAGLREGDVILAVNGKSVHKYKLQEVLHMLNEREGKKVKLRIERYNSDLLFTFVLENMFK